MDNYSLDYCQNAYTFDNCQAAYPADQAAYEAPTLTELTGYQEIQSHSICQTTYTTTFTEYSTTPNYYYDPFGYNPNIVRAEQAYASYLNSFGVAPAPMKPDYCPEEDALAPVTPSMEEPKKRGRKRKQINYGEDSGEEEEETSSKKKWKATPTTSYDSTGEIDTQRLADEVNITMSRLKIPQTKFAVKVINRSQGTLSDLLKRPKPWAALQPKGKQTYEMMRQWLELSDSKKIAAVEDDYESSCSPEKRPSPSKVGKKRLAFTTVQKRVLEALFEKDNYPSEEMQQAIASKLRVDVSTVKNFMQNRRNRGRRELTRSRKNSCDWE